MSSAHSTTTASSSSTRSLRSLQQQQQLAAAVHGVEQRPLQQQLYMLMLRLMLLRLSCGDRWQLVLQRMCLHGCLLQAP
jgi:hypothetical protein